MASVIDALIWAAVVGLSLGFAHKSFPAHRFVNKRSQFPIQGRAVLTYPINWLNSASEMTI